METLRIENDNVIYTICEYDKMDHTKLRKHIHHFYEILYLLDGTISYIIEDKEYIVKKGDILLIESAKYHYVKEILVSPYKRICFEFVKDVVDNDDLLNIVYKKTPLFVLPEKSFLPYFFQTIQAYGDARSDFFPALCKSTLTLILLTLYKMNKNEAEPKTSISKACNLILTYINDNINEIYSIEQIAKHFFYSKSYISHVFKREMQVGIMQYVRNKKILLADKMIQLGTNPTEVAKKLGFNNYISFYRSYSAFFKRSPSENKPQKHKKQISKGKTTNTKSNYNN